MLQKNLALALLALLLTATVFPDVLFAQDATPFNLKVTSSVYGSTNGALPFWLHTNKDGKIDSNSVNWVNEIGLHTDLFDYGNLSVDAGANLVGRLSNNSSAHFIELYLHADFGGYRLSAGRFIDPIGLNNHELSIGSMMVSRNATPIPKISLYTPEFLDVPWLNGRVQYKGMFSHGRMEDRRFVSNTLLHQKYFYLRVNAGNFSGTGGVIHNVMWGGTHPELGKLPQSFNDFLDVVAGNSSSSSSATARDSGNVVGNSIAAYEFGLAYTGKSFNISLTRLFYLEDKVSTRFRSPWDGVWGLNIGLSEKNRVLSHFIYEHINTKQQDAKDGETIGRASYYNNNDYESGWSYNDRVIGLPLFTTDPESVINNITNNIVIGHHLGFNGMVSSLISYKIFFTYSRNYGINADQRRDIDLDLENRRKDQYSLYLDLRYQLPKTKNLSISLSVASDTGQLYEDNIGFGIGLSWTPYH